MKPNKLININLLLIWNTFYHNEKLYKPSLSFTKSPVPQPQRLNFNTQSPLHPPPTFNFIIVVAYNGAKFSGWTNHIKDSSINSCHPPSISNYLKYSILKLHGKSNTSEFPFSLIAASRTDRGVHATGAVCQFLSNSPSNLYNTTDAQKLHHALNCIMHKDIRIRSILPSPYPLFNVKFHNIGKTYSYDFDTSLSGNIFSRAESWILAEDKLLFHSKKLKHNQNHFPVLNLNKMRDAARLLTGEHDFEPLANRYNGKNNHIISNTVCRIEKLEIHPLVNSDTFCDKIDSLSPATRFRIIIKGNRFLYKMIRNITGSLIQVGMDIISLDKVNELLSSPLKPHQAICKYTAPPQGLKLRFVHFEPELEQKIKSSIEANHVCFSLE